MHNILPSQPRNGAVLRHAADNVRRFRGEAGLSQAELAGRSGLSRRMINGLEAGTANISLANLDAIAAALHTSFVDLVRAPRSGKDDIREILWQGRAPGSHAVLLGAAPAGSMVELWNWVLAPGDHYEAKPDMPGCSEMIVVTEGELTIEFDDQRKQLARGECLIFSSAQRYVYQNHGAGAARFIRNVIN